MGAQVAIVVACYNTEEFILDCLDSIARQTLGDFACITVDDGSDDGTYGLLRDFAASDQRFVVIKSQHSGVSGARNLGLEEIKNLNLDPRYVCFVDSDDIVRPEYLESFVRAMDGNDAEYAVCGHWQFVKTGVTGTDSEIPRFEVLGKDAILERYFALARGRDGDLYQRHDVTDTWALFNRCFSYKLIENPSPIRFNENFFIGEDLDFFVRVSRRISKGVVIPKVLYLYRQREYSLSHDEGRRLVIAEGKVQVLDCLLHGSDDQYVSALLRLMLFISLYDVFRCATALHRPKCRSLYLRLVEDAKGLPPELPNAWQRIKDRLRFGFIPNLIYASIRNYLRRRRQLKASHG